MLRRSFLALPAALVGALRGAGHVARPSQGPLTETRIYRGCAPGFQRELESCLSKAGLRPVSGRGSAGEWEYVFRFESAEARQAAWARVNTLDGWPGVAKGFRSYEFRFAGRPFAG